MIIPLKKADKAKIWVYDYDYEISYPSMVTLHRLGNAT